jgi:TrpR family trp operon transcriptional repressor
MVAPKTRGWKTFLKLIKEVQSQEELDDLLKALLTHEERDQLALRVELIGELMRHEKPQRQIASELGVSIATITRGSNMLKTIKAKLRHFFENHLINT